MPMTSPARSAVPRRPRLLRASVAGGSLAAWQSTRPAPWPHPTTALLSLAGWRTIVAAVALAATMPNPTPANAEPLERLFGQASARSSVSIDHSGWDRLLKTYVITDPQGLNRVAYARFKREAHGELMAYITRLETTNVAQLDRNAQFAFWANLYNAKTIDIVLERYPVASIKDINLGGGRLASVQGGPWSAKVTKVSSRELSLDDIEHGIMRRIFRDPLVHYAVNCAAIGCPNLWAEAFVGERLDKQLDAAARSFVNSPRGVRVLDSHIQASSIYSWFQPDFGGSTEAVVRHLERYAEPELKAALRRAAGNSIAYSYDWRLNDVQ